MVIDILCLVLIVLIVWASAKRGVFIVILQALAYVIAGIVSYLSAPYITSFIYDRFARQQIMDRLYTQLPSGSVGGGLYQSIEAAATGLPDKIRQIAEFLHLLPTAETKEQLAQVLTLEELETRYISPIVTKVLTFITMLLLFIVISVILRLAAAWINKALFEDRDGILGTVNKTLGGILGVLKGAIPVVFIGLLLVLLAPVIENEFLIGQVEKSYLCSFLTHILV